MQMNGLGFESQSAQEATTEPVLVWKVHLLRESPRKVLLVIPIVAISLVAGYIFTHSLLVLAVTLFLFVSALIEYLFPIRYELTSRGASAYTLLGRTTIEWERVRKYYIDDYGIKLSPLPSQGRLEPYRGVYLRFGRNKNEVMEVVRRMRDVRTASDSR